MRLVDVEIGKTYILLNIDKLGRCLKGRLIDFGLIDCEFNVLVKTDGPILLEVRGTKVGIGRGMAMKIEVKEVI